MTYKENVTAILECNFAGFKQEIIDTAVDCIMALSAEPCRTADDYENEIADLHNRLDIAEYDKERYKEEITTLETKNKGEWIESKERSKHWYCSVCGGIHTDPETGKWRETFDYRYPFCPNCGARMKGGEE
jgi:frataxin-like iron-binding protein CyaY